MTNVITLVFILIFFVFNISYAAEQDPDYVKDIADGKGSAVKTKYEDKKNSSLNKEAMRFIADGDYKAAERTYRKIISRSPNEYLGYRGLAATLSYQQRYEEAEGALNTAVNINPNDAGSFAGLASLATMKYDFSEAEKLYSKAILLNSKLGLAHYGRGYSRFNLGEFELAKIDLLKSIELIPSSSLARKANELVLEIEKKSNQ